MNSLKKQTADKLIKELNKYICGYPATKIVSRMTDFINSLVKQSEDEPEGLPCLECGQVGLHRCETDNAITLRKWEEYLDDENAWEYRYNEGQIMTDYIHKIDFEDWLQQEER